MPASGCGTRSCSRGGRIAIDLAIEHPERVSGLVTVGSGPSGFPDTELTPEEDAIFDQMDATFEAKDWKKLTFPRNEGMRIDFILGSDAFAELVTDASILRNERKGDGPSDHVPVVVDLSIDGEDDDRPMIF